MTKIKSSSRRAFLKTSAVAGAAISVLRSVPSVHAAENSVLRIGLVGAGGRGAGAAVNALNADPNTKLTAICDAFEENAKAKAEAIKKQFPDRVDLGENVFFGLESYKDVIANCDVVLLCEAPHFRPMSLKAAIEAGKHVFCEKPVAVDVPGIHLIRKTCELAKEKGLNIVSGLCWRYDLNVQDMMKRIQDGAIGDLITVRETYLTAKPWTRSPKAGDTEMMSQVRNWLNFNWLSGDHGAEQHIHSLDKGLWAFGDVPPIAAFGIGARMQGTDQPMWGDVYDALAVCYEYPDGRNLYAYCRQQRNCFNEVEDNFTGTKGTAKILKGVITGPNAYTQKKVPSDMYTLEHKALFEAIRSGGAKYINNGGYMCDSTLLALLGRMCCYTGKRITWDELLASTETLAPSGYSFSDNPPTLPDEQGRYKIQVPGLGSVYHTVQR